MLQVNIINEKLFDWQLKALIASGGAVFNVIRDAAERPWVASPAGLFCREEDDSWRAVRRGVSAFWRINRVAGSGRHLWLAGMPHGMLRSADQGETWHPCRVEQTTVPVVAIAPSPEFAHDRVLLAATDGDGILRSTDGGRHWELANFGLREFMVVDVLMAGKIGRYEYAFAITENGFYQSPNGGRAWRLVDLGTQVAPLALAISPHFATDRTVCVGTETGQLFVSADAGSSWQCVSDAFDCVAGLAFAADDSLLVGTDTAVYRTQLTTPLALEIETVKQLPAPLLCLNTLGDTAYAGLVDGLWVSLDHGRTWRADDSLTARRMLWYVEDTLAGGMEEGVWHTADDGQTWQPIYKDLPVLGLATSAGKIWLSAMAGLLLSTDQGQTWQVAWEVTEPLTALAVVDEVVWAGTSAGQVWRGNEEAWEGVKMPFALPEQLVGFVVVEGVLLAASWSPVNNRLQLWRRGEDDWQLWFSQASRAVLPHVAASAGRVLIGLGSYVYRLTESGWRRQQIGRGDAPITAMCAVPGGWVAAVTDSLLCSTDGVNWQPLENDLAGEPVISLAVHEDKLVAGTAVGKIWVSPLS